MTFLPSYTLRYNNNNLDVLVCYIVNVLCVVGVYLTVFFIER